MMRSFIALVLLCSASMPVLAQQQAASSEQLPRRVEALEGQMRAVQRKVFPGGAPKYFEPEFQQGQQPAPGGEGDVAASTSALADINVRLQALEKQLADITGRVEQNENRVKQLEDQMQRFKEDVEFRLTQGATGSTASTPVPAVPVAVPTPVPAPSPVVAPDTGNGAKPSTAPKTTPNKSASVKPATTPPPAAAQPSALSGKPLGIVPSAKAATDAPYQAAYSAYQAKRYDDAIGMFEEFVSKNPKHALASNALFWQGKSYAAKKQYGLAARSYLRGYGRYRDSDKAEENLIGLAESLSAIDRREQACQALSEHQAVYKNATAANKAKVEALRKASRCN